MNSLPTYPIDFAALTKGSWITTEELEHSLGCKRTERRWQLAVLGLKEIVERKRTDLYLRIDHDRLRIMDDLEADRYSARRREQSEDAVLRVAGMRARIDRTDFDETQRAIAESEDRMALGMAMAVRSEQKRRRRLASGKTSEPQKQIQ